MKLSKLFLFSLFFSHSLFSFSEYYLIDSKDEEKAAPYLKNYEKWSKNPDTGAGGVYFFENDPWNHTYVLWKHTVQSIADGKECLLKTSLPKIGSIYISSDSSHMSKALYCIRAYATKFSFIGEEVKKEHGILLHYSGLNMPLPWYYVSEKDFHRQFAKKVSYEWYQDSDSDDCCS